VTINIMAHRGRSGIRVSDHRSSFRVAPQREMDSAMTSRNHPNPLFASGLLLLALWLVLSGCAGSRGILKEGPEADRLAPGLGVLYFDGMFRHVGKVPHGDRALLEKGRPGAPILIVDHQFGQNEVFDSGRQRGVGVQMKGYILLEKTGRYEFQALSNDGIEIIINGISILKDPGVHSDRLSDIGVYTAQEAGWHPIMAKYFQRKGTAALRFYWKPPGTDGFAVIPARAYSHLQEDGTGR
jgi:hypothetical protein